MTEKDNGGEPLFLRKTQAFHIAGRVYVDHKRKKEQEEKKVPFRHSKETEKKNSNHEENWGIGYRGKEENSDAKEKLTTLRKPILFQEGPHGGCRKKKKRTSRSLRRRSSPPVRETGYRADQKKKEKWKNPAGGKAWTKDFWGNANPVVNIVEGWRKKKTWSPGGNLSWEKFCQVRKGPGMLKNKVGDRKEREGAGSGESWPRKVLTSWKKNMKTLQELKGKSGLEIKKGRHYIKLGDIAA